MQSKLVDLVGYVRTNFPKDALDVCDSLELLNLALDGLLDSANRQISTLHKNKCYDKSMELLMISKEVSSFQTYISEYVTMLNVEAEIDEDDFTDETDISEEQKIIPNYAEYTVDSSVPHSLYEDFTHKKATAFSIAGARYEAKDWKDVLLQTCDILSEIDSDKFYTFIDDPVMKGRKVSYFCKTYIEKKNHKLKNFDIYVWTNLSANHIRNLIRKLLKKYGIKISEFYVYLRADYSSLHRDDSISETENQLLTEKIGKYVRMNMRTISNKQHRFSQNELMAMESKKWSKDTLGLDYPFFKPYIDGIDISEQIKEGTYGRYWKEIFEFNNKKFLITSQWFERNREEFDKWFQSL